MNRIKRYWYDRLTDIGIGRHHAASIADLVIGRAGWDINERVSEYHWARLSGTQGYMLNSTNRSRKALTLLAIADYAVGSGSSVIRPDAWYEHDVYQWHYAANAQYGDAPVMWSVKRGSADHTIVWFVERDEFDVVSIDRLQAKVDEFAPFSAGKEYGRRLVYRRLIGLGRETERAIWAHAYLLSSDKRDEFIAGVDIAVEESRAVERFTEQWESIL